MSIIETNALTRCKWLIPSYILLIVLFYLYNTSLPLSLIPVAGHDDGLFMSLGSSISRGHWLGQFSQFTLMKGAGLPIVLALLSWFQIPITIFYSILTIATCELLRRVLLDTYKSPIFAALIAILIMFYPGLDAIRILREPLLTSLTILAITLSIAFSNKVLNDNKLDRKLITYLGLTLGWICITREEWVTILLPLILIPCYLIFCKGNLKSYSLLVKSKEIAVFFVILAIPTIVVSSINFIYYGKYIANDFKEHEFVKTMTLLQSIESTKVLDNGSIPVPSDVRSKLYINSPAFHELEKYLDVKDAPLSGWQKPSCDQFPATCGDYGGNWFFWALRDSVFLAGYYKSPQQSYSYYKRLNDDIERLCISRMLSCKSKILPLPNMSSSQLLELPDLLLLSIKKVSLIEKPDIYNMPSMGNEKQLSDAAKFLHLANYYPSAGLSDFRENTKVNHDSQANNRNFSFKVKKFLFLSYSYVCPLIFIIGFMSFIGYLCSKNKVRCWTLILIVFWSLAFIRISLISVATAVTFALVNHQYLAFTGPVLLISSILSIGSLYKLYLSNKLMALRK